ncbi:hypothetical protein HETIRDRAFT_324020 [Heterobasidion irregulare TC 32-1]|uniref:Uncharacterized protein n=1 Tax=Heterobasidion irregulare (strain TC 32-1) TaxID=747525 RepID=W4K0F9_HETIT|nr:uncharacterized protein HETIRDRAFT_324020 [Heterobasidion irregulare TC 32-1]ETW79234.1 hypothetical protein HETIRDRAFT_324020 [Heterobasidion irregulare TC 32-1]
MAATTTTCFLSDSFDACYTQHYLRYLGQNIIFGSALKSQTMQKVAYSDMRSLIANLYTITSTCGAHTQLQITIHASPDPINSVLS